MPRRYLAVCDFGANTFFAMQMSGYRFKSPKTCEEEEICAASAIKSTRYKNKRAAVSFEVWRRARFPKLATLEPGRSL